MYITYSMIHDHMIEFTLNVVFAVNIRLLAWLQSFFSLTSIYSLVSFWNHPTFSSWNWAYISGFFSNELKLSRLKLIVLSKLKYMIGSFDFTLSYIHAFNKSGRHLEFSTNDVIRGKIIHVAKMATKDESSVDVDFAVCSCKKGNAFTLYQEEYLLYVVLGMLS